MFLFCPKQYQFTIGGVASLTWNIYLDCFIVDIVDVLDVLFFCNSCAMPSRILINMNFNGQFSELNYKNIILVNNIIHMSAQC